MASDERPTAPTNPEFSRPAQPPVVGHHVLLHRMGEGGMGEVWLAEQQRPVRRKVALKLLKAGTSSREMLARFESERQALALMSHPNVAKIHDAGVSEDDRPWFGMELVQGAPITDHCNERRLPLRERIELFCKACAGVEHAHLKGLIHRDLKPANILVTKVDGADVPKVIDFGIAKTTGFRLTEQTLRTELGVLMGTPEYMSPEQASLTTQDVDTRSDVYSLGVLLYELLTGALPLRVDASDRADFATLQRRIREERPPRPSTRVRSASPEQAAFRGHSDVGGWSSALTGDLDRIVAKCLEKEREHRYGSVRELREDLERHLRNEPIRARPPSAAYVAGKFIRRHRLAVLTGAGLALAAVLGVAGIAIGLVRARESEEAARREADVAAEVTDLMAGIFETSAPERALGTEPTVRQALERGAMRIRSQLQGEPELRGRLLGVVGRVHHGLGRLEEAESELSEALDLQAASLGGGHRRTVETRLRLGRVQRELARHAEAEDNLRAAVEGLRALDGARAPAALAAAGELAALFREADRVAEAETLLRRSLSGLEQQLGADDPRSLALRLELARVLAARDEYELAVPAAESVLARQEVELPPGHPALLDTRAFLADAYSNLARHEEAVALHAANLEALERVYDPEHPAIVDSLIGLAEAHDRGASLERAESLYRRAIRLMDRAGLREHTLTALAQADLAALLHRRSCNGEAEQWARAAVGTYESLLGPRHYSTVVNLSLLSGLCETNGKLAEAEAFRIRVCEGWRHAHPALYWETVSCHRVLGSLRVRLGLPDEARAAFGEYLRLQELRSGAESPEFAFARAVSHAWLGEEEAAIEALRLAQERGLRGRNRLSARAFEGLRERPEFRALEARFAGSD